MQSNEIFFVIETCQNCKSHFWNTRHDENKYIDYFNRSKFDFHFFLSGSRNSWKNASCSYYKK